MTEDRDLSSGDVQALSRADGVVAFFALLGYDTDARLPQTTAAMGITAESLQRQIRSIERVAVQEDGAEPLDVYLVELSDLVLREGRSYGVVRQVGRWTVRRGGGATGGPRSW